MIQFISLDTITNDLLKIVRGSKVSQSETISKRQIEDWIHQYRALLIKQDIDKGKIPNPDYIQEIPSLRLEVVDATMESEFEAKKYVLRTELKIPHTIDFNFKSGFTYIGTMDGKELQFVPESRARWQKHKRFTSREPLAFLRNNRIYIHTVTPITYVTVRGMFEIPTEVSNFVNPVAEKVHSTLQDRYPIPSNWVSVLKSMILERELGIIVQSPSDNKNDGANMVSPNAEGYARADD